MKIGKIVSLKKRGIKGKIAAAILVLALIMRVWVRLDGTFQAFVQPSTDMSVKITKAVPKSVHFAERTLPVRHIVVHSFALPVDEMVAKMNKLGVSTHYLIDTNGTVTKLVPEDKVAWHAGYSYWRGASGLNATSIGIELQNNTLGQTAFSDEQITAFQILARDIMYRYQIDPKNVVAHSDIAPTRKVDVGHSFPWQKMAALGIGLWPKGQVPQKESQDIGALLRQIGYDTTDEGKALLAFERHFMPDLIKKDTDIAHLEENLAGKKPVRNPLVIKRLNEVAALYK